MVLTAASPAPSAPPRWLRVVSSRLQIVRLLFLSDSPEVSYIPRWRVKFSSDKIASPGRMSITLAPSASSGSHNSFLILPRASSQAGRQTGLSILERLINIVRSLLNGSTGFKEPRQTAELEIGGPGVTGGQALPVGVFRESSHFLPAFKSWF